MKHHKLTVGAGIACLSLGVLAPSSATAQQLPKVWVGGPNPAPCYDTIEVNGKFVNHEIALRLHPARHGRRDAPREWEFGLPAFSATGLCRCGRRTPGELWVASAGFVPVAS